jgi:hypothetical protein
MHDSVGMLHYIDSNASYIPEHCCIIVKIMSMIRDVFSIEECRRT